MDFVFAVTNILLGVGLAMDAFTVSLANGLADPGMSRRRALGIAGTFGFFQALMPLAGWLCVHTAMEYFSTFEVFIPYISLALLTFIGVNMIRESRSRTNDEACPRPKLDFVSLLIQGVATSIDALSVGFTIADYSFPYALCAALIIAFVTLIICCTGVELGKKFGTRFSGKADILGGCILIFIGIEIFIKGIM